MDAPYLLFIGNETDALDAKTASGVAYWRPNDCVGQLRSDNKCVDLGVPDMSLADGKKAGAKTLLIGIANEGGFIPDSWIPVFIEALEQGYNLASGLHARLHDIPALKILADEKSLKLYDVRTPQNDIPIGTGIPRSGKRLLTVGTDCAVGKMFTVLALEKEMKQRGLNADFRATGQTGIFIAGKGVPIDAVVSDFIAGAAEYISPAADDDHWDLIEGQGSLYHPSYAGVTLGLVHGSQPDNLILCHRMGQTTIAGHPDYAIPPLEDVIKTYEAAAQLTNKNARVVGISLVTKGAQAEAALAEIQAYEDRYSLPCFDPVRTGVSKMVDYLETFSA
ncbi:N-acetyltransferase DgcN [Kordiimonas pumila]|uniref:N-acetyltransferase DgcN n=1 Tax=Kordiimonas pumila TaxID=2161677 RepID=A0ABV7D590_9PROT|nr:N-acetyltransferase DgcN [Kordiimonas pumila]